LLGGLLALAMAAFAPSVASAKPEPGVKRSGFRLFARSLGAFTINRVYCGISTSGEVCVDSTNSSTIGGGFWPKGTGDQYVFNTGLQIAGIIGGSKPDNPWGGDTTGAFFFNARGDNVHGQEVQPIYNATNPDDVAAWPDAARVPSGDASQELFFPVLRDRISASQGDIWFMSWEGDPSTGGGRPHPMGIATEVRGMGWNYPTGNQDIVYLIYTFYNITSLNPADYASIRPSMQEILLQKAQQFHALNNAEYGVDLPDAGYDITNMFAAFGADMDVGSAGDNYSTVELPFALGNTYQKDFGKPNTWTFDPGIFAPPLFAGVGFVGVKYLKSPTGPGAIQLFGNTINGGAFGDARNTTQLFRYLSGNISTAAGDAPCNTGDPVETHVCYVNNTAADDMRFFQSSTPLTLGPGQFGSIAVAYIFAAPAIVGSFSPGGSTDLPPGDPRFFSDLTKLTTPGAINMVDSLAGFKGYSDKNGDGIAQQDEYTVVPGSLLGKALVAQQVFDSKFLLAFAPDAPQFFLVPGDNQVTVLWRPSATETTGDPFFEIASSPMTVPEGGGDPVINNLYDPNYRQFDVEGYRVYRGRVDAPSSLTLLAQFDYAGTSISDFSGFVGAEGGTDDLNELTACAPDIGLFTNCITPYNPAEFVPGVARTVSHEVPLVGGVVQVKSGSRAELADGSATILPLQSDTVLTGNDAGFPQLGDTGVPFVYVDRGVRNNFRYFYAVTAFDVNSFASGPSSIESARITKAVTPHVGASNAGGGSIQLSMIGRDGPVDFNAPVPTLDPTTGTFSGPFPAANSWAFGLGSFVSEVLQGQGGASATLDSIQLGSPYQGTAHTYWFTVTVGDSTGPVSISLTQNQEIGVVTDTIALAPLFVSQQRAALFGGNSSFFIPAKLGIALSGPDYAGLWGRGCVNGRSGFTVGDRCEYNGSRWFAGPSPQNNETQADPNAGNTTNFAGEPVTNYNNSGALPGVVTIFQPQAYQDVPSTWRNVIAALSGARRAADFNVYWGEGGKVDSVFDVSNDVIVPFGDHYGGSWGILNPGAGAADFSADAMAALTTADFQCVEPLFTFHTGPFACPAAAPYQLSQTATPGPVAFFSGGQAADPTAATVAANAGIGFYISGDIFVMELEGGQVPAAGTVWSLRSYVGAISGGNGAAGPGGDYAFRNPEGIRPLTSVGTRLESSFNVDNSVVAPTLVDLDRVHTVPDPYYITNEYEQSTDIKILKFVNLPDKATIRIYSSSGVLVDVLEHNSPAGDGTESWNLQNRNHQVVASGVYFYHIEAGDARRVGRFTVVNFAQ
ncbi:MAG TPA: T9SS type A sorting domain-containing protein, partial [Gemmatimonadales bacterium]